jgi:hypothetical protein
MFILFLPIVIQAFVQALHELDEVGLQSPFNKSVTVSFTSLSPIWHKFFCIKVEL